MRRKPEPFRILAVFDAQVRAGQIGSGPLFNGAEHPRIQEACGDTAAHREPRLVLGIEEDAHRVVRLALSVEECLLRRQERQRCDGRNICFWQNSVQQPMVIGGRHMLGPGKAIKENVRDEIVFGPRPPVVIAHLICPCRRRE